VITELVNEAICSGARLEAAVEALGLSVRTVQRWQTQDDGADQRRGPKTAPSNKLTAAEREKVLATANAAEFRDLSPKQIVPRLADRGDYIASESTFYRVLRDED
jgi:transposase